MTLTKMMAGFSFTKGLGVIVDTGTNFIIIKTLFSRFYISLPGHSYQVGDILFLSGIKEHYFFPFLEGDFNYGEYLQNKGIYYALTNTELRTLFSSPLHLLKRIKLNDRYPAYLENIKQLLLFNKRDYNDPILSEVASANLLFTLTLSGIHLSLIRRMVKKGCSIFFSVKTSDRISYVALLPLFLLDVTKFAFYRIFMSGFARYINKRYLKSRFNHLELNVVVAFLFLLINPFLITTPSFYLAYLLIFAFTLVESPKGMIGKLKNVSILWMILVPYQIFSNQSFSVLSLVLPPLLTPLVATWYVIYHLTLFLIPLERVGMNLLNLIYTILQFSAPLERSLYLAEFSPVVVLVVVFLLGFLWYAHLYKIKPLRRSTLFLIGVILVANNVPYINHLMYRITFINVGQGDAILINAKGKHVLIDTGGLYNRDVSEEILIPYFKRHRVYALDYLLITHDDFDHSGGVDSLKSSFPVREIIREPDFVPFTLNQATFYNLNPGGYDDPNLDSLIIYITFPKFQMLLMGDAGIQNEEALLSDYPGLTVDYLKLGHHGSNTSTSDAFIKHYLPHTAIISCGYNNRYGHPHQEVLNTLTRYNVQVRRTDLEGTIVIERW